MRSTFLTQNFSSHQLPTRLIRSQCSVAIRFEPTKSGARVIWDSPEFGSVKSVLRLPFPNADLPIIIRAIDVAQHPPHPNPGGQFSPLEQELLDRYGLWQHNAVPSGAHRIVGRKIFEALTRSTEGHAALKSARDAARRNDRTISYVLHFPPDAVELAALPSEALWDNRQALLFSRGGGAIDSLERHIDLGEAMSPPIAAGKRLRILALAPKAGIPADIHYEERMARLKSWEALRTRDLLDWDESSPVTIPALNQYLRDGRLQILFITGTAHVAMDKGVRLDHAEYPGRHADITASRLAARLGGVR